MLLARVGPGHHPFQRELLLGLGEAEVAHHALAEARHLIEGHVGAEHVDVDDEGADGGALLEVHLAAPHEGDA